MILSLGLIDCVDDIGFHRSAFFDGPFFGFRLTTHSKVSSMADWSVKA